MLTNRPAEGSSALSLIARLGAAMVLSVVVSTSAFAGNVIDSSCVGGGKSFNCVAQWSTTGDPYVRTVPEVVGEAAQAEAAARDHRWTARCSPVTDRDEYGVARYHYSKPGCEFGLGAD